MKYLVGITVDQSNNIKAFGIADIGLNESNKMIYSTVTNIGIDEIASSTISKVYVRVEEIVGGVSREERELVRELDIAKIIRGEHTHLMVSVLNEDNEFIGGAPGLELIVPINTEEGVKKSRIGYVNYKGELIDKNAYIEGSIEHIGMYTEERKGRSASGKGILFRVYKTFSVDLCNESVKFISKYNTVGNRITCIDNGMPLSEISTLYKLKIEENREIVRVEDFYIVYGCIWVKTDTVDSAFEDLSSTYLRIGSIQGGNKIKAVRLNTLRGENVDVQIEDMDILSNKNTRIVDTYDSLINVFNRDGYSVRGTGCVQFIDKMFIDQYGKRYTLREFRDKTLAEQGSFFNRYKVPIKYEYGDMSRSKGYLGSDLTEMGLTDECVEFSTGATAYVLDKTQVVDKGDYYVMKDKPMIISKKFVKYLENCVDIFPSKRDSRDVCAYTMWHYLASKMNIPHLTADKIDQGAVSEFISKTLKQNRVASYNDTYDTIYNMAVEGRMPIGMLIQTIRAFSIAEDGNQILDKEAIDDYVVDHTYKYGNDGEE